MKRFGISAVMAMALAATEAVAQIQPPGVEGKDWAKLDFEITTGATVDIAVTNTTVNALDGSVTRIILMVNGRTVADNTSDHTESSITYQVAGNYTYNVVALCKNSRAEASSCRISAKKAEKQSF